DSAVTGIACGVVDDWQQLAVGVAAALTAETAQALHDAPAVVAALRDQVNLFARVLADVAHPQSAALRVEREAPGVAQAIGVDLVAAISATIEGVIGGNAIRPAGIAAGDIEAQQLAQKYVGVLAVAHRVAAAAAVAEADVEEAVRPEGELTTL